MTINDATKDFVSIGCLAGQLQRPVRAIEQAAKALQIDPALRLNGVAHFDGGQVERLAEALRTKQKH